MSQAEETPSHVVVQFHQGVEGYTYWNHIPGITVDDHVVVRIMDSREGTAMYAAGRVVSITPHDDQKSRATKWVVQKIDPTVHDALTAMSPEPPKLSSPSPEIMARLGSPTPAWLDGPSSDLIREYLEHVKKSKGVK